MAFRRDEEIEKGFEIATRYLIPKELSQKDAQALKYFIDDLIVRLGPVVSSYPSWHPLVCHKKENAPSILPSDRCGYRGLDHTIFFANGFLSCPYGDGEKILDSVGKLRKHEAHKRYSHLACIEAERVDKPLYNDATDPILVVCEWEKPINSDRTIPKDIAVGLMLEEEVPHWRESDVGETWETMRSYLLGEPCGKRSSMFLDQEAGQTMKKVYEAITYSGMFGPLKV